MNRYQELRDRQQEEFNKFPLGFAFDNKQFKELMEKWGLTEDDTDKICRITGGGFVRKSDYKELQEMLLRHNREIKRAVKADDTGEGFVYEMFAYELANHEYGYTRELEDTLDCLGYSEDEVIADEKLLTGLRKALRKYGRTL